VAPLVDPDRVRSSLGGPLPKDGLDAPAVIDQLLDVAGRGGRRGGVSFGSDDRTDRVIAAVQRDGTAWMGGTTWRGRRYMRISVSNWSTTEADVDRSVEAIRRLLREG
jgi:hypothetical protein